MNVQLLVDALRVRRHRTLRYEQRFGNVAPGPARAQVAKDLFLALGEAVLLRDRRCLREHGVGGGRRGRRRAQFGKDARAAEILLLHQQERPADDNEYQGPKQRKRGQRRADRCACYLWHEE